MLKLIAMMMPGALLYRWSAWGSNSGDPMNVWAEELLRREGML